MTKREKAIEKYEDKINETYKKLRKEAKEQLMERAKSLNVYTDNGKYNKNWIAYDIAVKMVTGY